MSSQLTTPHQPTLYQWDLLLFFCKFTIGTTLAAVEHNNRHGQASHVHFIFYLPAPVQELTLRPAYRGPKPILYHDAEKGVAGMGRPSSLYVVAKRNPQQAILTLDSKSTTQLKCMRK
jgi:hypothetical protein